VAIRGLSSTPQFVLATKPTAALDRDSAHKVVDSSRKPPSSKARRCDGDPRSRIIEKADRLVHMVDGRMLPMWSCRSAEDLRIPEDGRRVQEFDADRADACRREGGEAAVCGRRLSSSPGRGGEDFYLISDGTSKVMREGHDVARLGAGIFSVKSLITGEPRNATVLANDISDLCARQNRVRAAIEASRSFATSSTSVFLRH